MEESIEDGDYRILILEIDGVEYTFVHGFPGDNAAGSVLIDGKPVISISDGYAEVYDDYQHNRIANTVVEWYRESLKTEDSDEDYDFVL